MKKKKTKRSSKKYPALDPLVNLKTRVELIDYDYLDKLSPAEKKWLNKFTEEYAHASFKKNAKHIQKDKEHKRDSYNRNNARNRCIYTRSKASGNLDYIEDLKEFEENYTVDNVESKLIDKIDDQKLLENLDKTGDGTDDDGNKSS